MPKRQLHIATSGHRATLEEQDDTIVWLCHALRGAGATLDLLLAANAVGCAVRSQRVDPLRVGGHCQRHAPDLPGDLAALLARGVACFYVEEDAAERGIDGSALIDGVTGISRAKLPALFDNYDQVHRW
jgi:hypothetical protein